MTSPCGVCISQYGIWAIRWASKVNLAGGPDGTWLAFYDFTLYTSPLVYFSGQSFQILLDPGGRSIDSNSQWGKVQKF